MNEADFLKKVGANIARIREEKGFKQTELAARARLERQNMYRIEKGKQNVTILMLNQIANALDVPAKDLLDFN